ncbi:MAG: ABC transporter permease subunit [Bacteroidota bacterium]
MIGLLLLTLRELRAKWIVVGLFGVATVLWVLLASLLNLDVVDGTLAGMRVAGGTVSMEGGGLLSWGGFWALPLVVMVCETGVAGGAYWLGILLALFATGALVTSLMERGQIDLTLSKPLSRTQVLGGRVLGVWGAMLVLFAYLFVMVWIVMAFKSEIWNPRFLLTIGIVFGMFVTMYSVTTLVSVISGSTALALIVTYGVLFASLPLGAHSQLAPVLSPGFREVYLAAYHVLPKFPEVTGIVGRFTLRQEIPTWYPFLSSLGFGAVCYGIAFWRFSRKDF